MRRAAVSLLLLALGCTEGLPPAPPPPAPPKPVPPEPDLPPLAEVAYPEWSEVDGETFPEIPAPAAPSPLLWDFSPGRRVAYDFSQTLSQVVVGASAGAFTETRSRDRNRGTFEFAAARDRTAKAFIRIETQESVRNGVPAPKEEIEKHPASTFECRVQEDGTAEVKKLAGQSDAQFFFDALLALTEGEKKVKDGIVRTKVSGYFKVGRHDCARLETEFDLAPQTPSGASLLRGRTVGYFALRERQFIRSTTAVGTSLRLKALNPNLGWITNSIDSKTVLRLKLLP